ncbi:MAG: dihydroorotate dehydrogenase electron transfer subunit [Planctomycetes bacterium]|nr:dihydroorotate dehydrogenase electron transfer subunit [Planctomycetota bacterium]
MSKTKKGLFEGVVSFNKQIGERFYRLGLRFKGEAGKAFAGLVPGQFAEFDISTAGLPACGEIPDDLRDSARRELLLRRPFSFCNVEIDGDEVEVEILYCVVGAGTIRMTTLAAGDIISVVGPLGNGFSVPESKSTALLVVGGMGAPPILHLAKVLKEKHPEIETVGFVGAKSAVDFPLEEIQGQSKDALKSMSDFELNGVTWQVASDEGDIGHKGFVTEKLEEWLGSCDAQKDTIIIYSCGPAGMLRNTAAIAERHGVDCQVSMEQMMACGIGLCQSCAIECKGDGGTEYKLCCKDGPVFDSRDVVFKV